MNIARKILEIKALSQTLCNITKNETTNTQIKVLYFIDTYKTASPQMLISKLGIVKSNLALITKNMIENNLIISEKGICDKRSVFYSITEKGKNMLNNYIDQLNKIINKDNEELSNSLDIVLKYLNKKI